MSFKSVLRARVMQAHNVTEDHEWRFLGLIRQPDRHVFAGYGKDIRGRQHEADVPSKDGCQRRDTLCVGPFTLFALRISMSLLLCYIFHGDVPMANQLVGHSVSEALHRCVLITYAFIISRLF